LSALGVHIISVVDSSLQLGIGRNYYMTMTISMLNWCSNMTLSSHVYGSLRTLGLKYTSYFRILLILYCMSQRY